MIFDLPWWNSVLTLSLADPIRCTEFYWFDFPRLLSLNHPFIKSMKWESIPFIKVTTSLKDAFTWYISDISINNENPYYPLDRLWICSTNSSVDEINSFFSQELKDIQQQFDPIFGLTEIINKDQYDTNIFPETNQLDMLNNKNNENLKSLIN